MCFLHENKNKTKQTPISTIPSINNPYKQLEQSVLGFSFSFNEQAFPWHFGNLGHVQIFEPLDAIKHINNDHALVASHRQHGHELLKSPCILLLSQKHKESLSHTVFHVHTSYALIRWVNKYPRELGFEAPFLLNTSRVKLRPPFGLNDSRVEFVTSFPSSQYEVHAFENYVDDIHEVQHMYSG